MTFPFLGLGCGMIDYFISSHEELLSQVRELKISAIDRIPEWITEIEEKHNIKIGKREYSTSYYDRSEEWTCEPKNYDALMELAVLETKLNEINIELKDYIKK